MWSLRRMVSSMLLAFQLAGCTSWKPSKLTPQETVSDESKVLVRLTASFLGSPTFPGPSRAVHLNPSSSSPGIVGTSRLRGRGGVEPPVPGFRLTPITDCTASEPIGERLSASRPIGRVLAQAVHDHRFQVRRDWQFGALDGGTGSSRACLFTSAKRLSVSKTRWPVSNQYATQPSE